MKNLTNIDVFFEWFNKLINYSAAITPIITVGSGLTMIVYNTTQIIQALKKRRNSIDVRTDTHPRD